MFQRYLLGLVVLLLMASIASAAEPAASKPATPEIRVSGFGFGSYDSELEKVVGTHLWFVLQANPRPDVDVLAFITPVGPPGLLHHLHLRWKQPTSWLDSLSVGKMTPPFGEEFAKYRIDKVQGGFYSTINNRMVAKDTGIVLTGHDGRLQLTCGIFAGRRVGGNIARIDRDHADLYLKGDYRISPHLSGGVSQRAGPVPATALHLVYDRERLRLAHETVWSLGQAESYWLVVYRMNSRLSLFNRYEVLTANTQIITGIDWQVGQDSLRVAYVDPGERRGRWVIQFVDRF